MALATATIVMNAKEQTPTSRAWREVLMQCAVPKRETRKQVKIQNQMKCDATAEIDELFKFPVPVCEIRSTGCTTE